MADLTTHEGALRAASKAQWGRSGWALIAAAGITYIGFTAHFTGKSFLVVWAIAALVRSAQALSTAVKADTAADEIAAQVAAQGRADEAGRQTLARLAADFRQVVDRQQ